MRNILLLFILMTATQCAYAGSPWYYGSGRAVNLEDTVSFDKFPDSFFRANNLGMVLQNSSFASNAELILKPSADTSDKIVIEGLTAASPHTKVLRGSIYGNPELGDKWKGEENYFLEGTARYGRASEWTGANFSQVTGPANSILNTSARWQWTDTGTIGNQLESPAINIPLGMRQSELGYSFRYRYDGEDNEVDVLIQCVADSEFLIAAGEHPLTKYTVLDGSALAAGEFAPNGCAQVKIILKMALANPGKEIAFDGVKVTPFRANIKKITESQTIQYVGFTARSASIVQFTSLEINEEGSFIEPIANLTRVTFKRACDFIAVYNYKSSDSGTDADLILRDSAGAARRISPAHDERYSTMTIKHKAQAGDYIEVLSSTDPSVASDVTNLTVTATADADHIVRPVGIEDVDSMIRLSGHPAYASGGAYAITMPTTEEQIGNAVIYTRDAVNGDTFEVTSDGVYNLSANLIWDNATGDGYHGFTKNDVATNTIDSASTPTSKRLCMSNNSTGSYGGGVASCSPLLKKGDVIRWVGSGRTIYPPATTYFGLTISKAKVNATVVVPIDDEYQNEFSARIANNGTASIISQSSPFIESITRSSVGIIVVVFKPGFFSKVPAVNGEVEVNSPREVNPTALSASEVTLRVYNPTSNATVDADFSIAVSRQGSDYKKKSGLVTGRFSKSRTCIIEERKLGNGGTNVVGYNVRTLNTKMGACEFLNVTLGTEGLNGTGNRFSLKKGKYNISCTSTSYRTNRSSLNLFEMGTGLIAFGPPSFFAQATDTAGISHIYHVMTVSSLKEYELHLYTQTIRASQGLGLQTSGLFSNTNPYDVYSQCKITKVL